MLDFAAVDALLPEVAARLRAEFEDASELPDADLHAFLRPVLRRAALNGFEDADDGFVYAACAWLTGEDFASAFETPRAILAGSAATADKAAALEDWLTGLIDPAG